MNTNFEVKNRTFTLKGLNFCLLVFFLILFGLVRPVEAGNNGYFVTYNSKVEKGELELMLMTDLTAPSHFRRDEGFGDYLSHMVELEYGITHQLATEFMIEWFEDLETGDAAFTGFRWENRFRLFKREVPLNPMVYLEYEDLDPKTRFKMETSGWVDPPYEVHKKEPDRERILESRLVLSQDVGPVNLAFNWINETDVTTGDTAFGYALAAMWMIHAAEHEREGKAPASPESALEKAYTCPMHPDVRSAEPGRCPRCGMKLEPVSDEEEEEHHGKGVGLGLEMYGGLGDTKSFGLNPKRQEHYLGPIIMYHFSEHWMTHAQLAVGLSKASDNLVRVNFGYDF